MNASLRILTGEAENRVIPLTQGRYEIGRGEEAAIRIDSRRVSRRHAEVVVEGGTVRILDCGSQNGTLLNGTPVTSAELRHGDRISIGEVVLEFCAAPDGEARPSLESAPAGAGPAPAPLAPPRSLQRTFTLALAAALGSLSLLGGLSYRSLVRERLAAEALDRAGALTRLLAEKNREDLRVGNELLLDTDSVRKEKGVREAFIIGRKGRILAPVTRLNQVVTDPFTAEALAQKSDRSILPSPELPDGTRVLVHPVRAYDDRTGTYETLGAVKLVFSPSESIGALAELNRLLYLLLGSALLLSLLLGWAAARVTAGPIRRAAETLQQWRAGLRVSKTSPPFREWGPLYDAIDRLTEEPRR